MIVAKCVFVSRVSSEALISCHDEDHRIARGIFNEPSLGVSHASRGRDPPQRNLGIVLYRTIENQGEETLDFVLILANVKRIHLSRILD